MSGFLTILLIVLSLVLIVLVLIQPDKSKGMSTGFGMQGSNSVFGVSKEGDGLAKTTQGVAICFLVVALLRYLVSL